MARILIRCSIFDKPANMIKLDTLDITLSMRCPACDRIHKWKQKDAWIEELEE
jgi:hypothetical protein